MPIAWIATRTEPRLIDALRGADWEIRVFTPVELNLANLSESGDFHVIIFQLSDSPLLDLCREICQSKIAPTLVIVPNLAYAQAAIEVGAEDFVVMSVEPLEVVLRVGKLARTSDLIRVGELQIDLPAWRVSYAGQRVQLSPVEFRLLACLAKRVGQMVNHATILEEVWGWEAGHGTLAQVKNYIGRLRRKIEPDFHHPQYIITIMGEGYRLRNQIQWKENLHDGELVPD